MRADVNETHADGSVRRNALIGWVLLGGVVLSAMWNVGTGNPLWGAFEVTFVAVAALPAAAARDSRIVVPWPLLALGAVALVGQTLGFHQELTSYTAVAAFALVGVAELDAYTEVEMSRRFTIAFAVLATMAVQGVWTVVRFYADGLLGTSLVVSQARIQWDFVFVTLVAVVVGSAFELYFKRAEGGGSEQEPAVSDT
ncbi:hypothetical protein [Halobacterium bonnevillei]|uniref:Uncharacterized protein n=1 Tax=Halobacterium bonnevillei TaxID=2692200 RepID=A0A6B0STR4_9EURY|nr:hypothetical protein [Halobacterium bonnevillei]MXR22210.1 hypothetical protein [Halobacterium bonnevillei]